MLAGHMNGGGRMFCFFFKDCSWTMQQRPVHDRTARHYQGGWSTAQALLHFQHLLRQVQLTDRKTRAKRPDDAHRRRLPPP
jgi:hypothetical protein